MITPPGNASYLGSLGGRSRELIGKLNNSYTYFEELFSRTYFFLRRATTGDIDYIENQCVVEEVDTSCKYEVYEGQDIGYADIQVQAGSAKEVMDIRYYIPKFTFTKMRWRFSKRLKFFRYGCKDETGF